MASRFTFKPRRGPESGAVAVEFAIMGPLFMVMVIGTLVWGQYLWVAHTVQQIANDSARAALAGMDAGEREQLARAALTSELADYGNLSPALASLAVEDRGDRVIVSIRYNTSTAAFRAFDGLVPPPPKVMVRQATVRLGGY